MSSQRPFNLIQAMREGVVTGDALDILPTLKPGSVDIFFISALLGTAPQS